MCRYIQETKVYFYSEMLEYPVPHQITQYAEDDNTLAGRPVRLSPYGVHRIQFTRGGGGKLLNAEKNLSTLGRTRAVSRSHAAEVASIS
jgi:hypothetical protein